jgi:hypothetical protein
MTELLEKALAEVSKLSAAEQDVVAALILDVLEMNGSGQPRSLLHRIN